MSSASKAVSHTATFKSLEIAITAFTQMAVVCTFGLAVAIGAAGLARTNLLLPCSDCATPVAMVAALPRA